MSNELRSHQQKILDDNPTCAGLFLGPRVGKTALSIRLTCKNAKSALFIVPKPLKEQWQDEINQWINADIKWLVITKEEFFKYHNVILGFEAVVVDESHKEFQSPKSRNHEALLKYFSTYDVKIRYLLSGTPYTSSVWSVFGAAKLLGRPVKKTEWYKAFFKRTLLGQHWAYVQKTGIESAVGKLVNQLGPTLQLCDIIDLPDDEIINENFDLSSYQQQLIRAIIETEGSARYTRRHQIESGVKLSDGYTLPMQFDCDKDKRIVELCEDNLKIAIVARYNLQLEKYYLILNEKFPTRPIYVINGQTKDKNDIVKKIHSDNQCIVLIQSQCSEGYSLKSIDVMVFASMGFGYVNYFQMTQRIKDFTKKRPVTYIHLLTRGSDSVDKGVKRAIDKGKNFKVAIFEYDKARAKVYD